MLSSEHWFYTVLQIVYQWVGVGIYFHSNTHAVLIENSGTKVPDNR